VKTAARQFTALSASDNDDSDYSREKSITGSEMTVRPLISKNKRFENVNDLLLFNVKNGIYEF